MTKKAIPPPDPEGKLVGWEAIWMRFWYPKSLSDLKNQREELFEAGVIWRETHGIGRNRRTYVVTLPEFMRVWIMKRNQIRYLEKKKKLVD